MIDNKKEICGGADVSLSSDIDFHTNNMIGKLFQS